MHRTERDRLLLSFLIALLLWGVLYILLALTDPFHHEAEIYQGPVEIILPAAAAKVSMPVDEREKAEARTPEDEVPPEEAQVEEAVPSPGETSREAIKPEPEAKPEVERGEVREEQAQAPDTPGMSEISETPPAPEESQAVESPLENDPAPPPRETENEVFESENPRFTESIQKPEEKSGEESSFFNSGADSALDEAISRGKESTEAGGGGGNPEKVPGEDSERGTTPGNPLDQDMTTEGEIFVKVDSKPLTIPKDVAAELGPTTELKLSFIVSPTNSPLQVEVENSAFPELDGIIKKAILNDWKFSNNSGKYVRVILKYVLEKKKSSEY